MAQLIGPHTQGRWGQGTKGVGIANVPLSGSWNCIVGKAGETAVYGIDQLLYTPPEVGTYVQSTGAVSLEYTLVNPELARSREPGMEITTWTAPQALTANTIEATEAPMWTAVRITFTEDAELYIYIV